MNATFKDYVCSVLKPVSVSPASIDASRRSTGRRARHRLWLALMLVPLAAGCTVPVRLEPQHIADRAVAYNQAVASAHERILLLNIVRAMYRHPQQWSVISRVRGAEAREASAGLSLPFGGDASSTFTGTAGAKISSSPGFDLDSLNDADFTRGIMKPIDASQLRYFADQGWPTGFLLLLTTRELIEQKSTTENGKVVWKTVRSWKNIPNPADGAQLNEFCKKLAELTSDRSLQFEMADQETSTLRVPADKVSVALEHLLRAIEAGRSVSYDAQDLVIREPQKRTVQFSLSELATARQPVDRSSEVAPDTLTSKQVTTAYLLSAETREEHVQVSGQVAPQVRFLFVPRSPEGLIYYLGQLGRSQSSSSAARTDGAVDPGTVPWYRDGGNRFAAFVLDSCGDCSSSFPSVEYNGEAYSVKGTWQGPEIDGDRSLMTLTFAQLLFGLQRKSQEFPATPVVIAQ